jgi:hemolysin III
MRTQTKIEEFYNVLTHGLGFLLSIVGLVLLLSYQRYDNGPAILGVFLYGFSLMILYFASTAYHYVQTDRRKDLFRKIDHISIYLLIAGSYSPVVLISLAHSSGWILFWTVWCIAGLGLILKIFFTGRFEIISVLLYLIMGWLIVFDFTALTEVIDSDGLWLLMGGGAAYTVGIIFYAMNKVKFSHVIWHLFVLAGSILHFLFIFLKVI